MIWATVSSWSCFCWLYRPSPSLAAKNIINLILVSTIWWRPCVESSLVLLEDGVCCDQCSPWQNSISLCPASFYTPRQQRHYFAYKGPSSQGYGFSCGHVWMRDLEYKESWVLFELWCWRRLLRVPWTARRSNQSTLKEISPEYSLEGLMLKFQYFGHLM